MSSFAFIGFLCLAQGRRVMTTWPNNTQTWHAHYVTSIQCPNSAGLPADLRIYSPMNNILHIDNTVVFVHACAQITQNGTVLLDASHLVPRAGNPEDDDYETMIPDFPYPFVITLGNVSGRQSHMVNGSHIFPMAVSEYVRDSVQLSNIVFVIFLPDFYKLSPFSPLAASLMANDLTGGIPMFLIWEPLFRSQAFVPILLKKVY